MAVRRFRWRRLGELLVGLAVGAICLVAWSSNASAAGLDTASPTDVTSSESPGSGRLSQLVDRVTSPVEQLVAPVGLDLGSVLDPVTTEVVAPTLDGLESSLADLTQPIVTPLPPVTPLPTAPVAPALPAVPVLTGPSDLGATTASPSAAPTASAVPGALAVLDPTTTPAGDGAGHHGELPAPLGIGLVSPDLAVTGGADGGSSDPGSPWSAPVAPGLVIGALAAAASAGGPTGLVLVAVLVGLAALAVSPQWRRLLLAGPRAPGALAYAITTPPG
jgi:hypothetical protein